MNDDKKETDHIQGRVLIVDDEQTNLKFLQVVLSSQGFEVRTGTNGAQALQNAKEDIDLILLDVMMPDIDGFETCRRLKSCEATREIPVIFLSALQDAEIKASGFEAGGVDYVSKPFDRRELLARVNAHITIRHQRRHLQQYALKLEHMVDERTRQLIHADRLATIGTLSAAIAHEVNNPLMFISGNTETLKLLWSSAKPAMEQMAGNIENAEVKKLMSKLDTKLEQILSATDRISELVKRLKTYSRKDAVQEACSPEEIVQDALHLLHYRIKHGVSILLDLSRDSMIRGNRQKLGQVFVNLINNAIDAMPDQKGEISIKGEQLQEGYVVYVQDSGSGIGMIDADKIFDAFFTTKTGTGGTGLGLFIVRQIIEEHGGTIHLMPYDGKGAIFKIVLPVDLRPQEANNPGD